MEQGPTRELIVLRHAKSSWDSDAESDFERPLSKRGRRDAPRMGRWLADEAAMPDCVVSSPARRARQTVRRVLEGIRLDPETVRFEERIYDAGVGDLIEILSECPADCRRVLIVGHNPGFESLVGYLTDQPIPASDGAKVFPTATAARLRMPADWSILARGDATLISLTRPRDLPQD